MRRLLLVLPLVGCAAGPRPVPTTATAEERLELAERALVGARGLTGTFEIESKGETAAHFTGTLELLDGNALHLTAEGNFRADLAQVELDARDSSGTVRTITKGPSVSSHRDPPAPALREAVALGLSRMGLLHNLAQLTRDLPVDKAEGGFQQWVKPLAPKAGSSDSINGEPCHRVEFGIEVSGAAVGEASVCIADATALPLHRTQTVRFPTGEMTVTETFKWTQQ